MRKFLPIGLRRVSVVKWSAVAFGCCWGWAGATITITPTYVDGEGENWTIARKAVVQQAINEWQDALAAPAAEGSVTINVTFDFTRAGTGGYQAVWMGSWAGVFSGSDTRPWLRTSHVIHFNADLFDTGMANYTWWDLSPEDGSDQPFEAWDALTLARHEVGHMLGFNTNLYRDNVLTASEVRLWEDRITNVGGKEIFDAGGLDIEMANAGDYFHVADTGVMAGDLMVPGLPNSVRRDISATDLDMLATAYGYMQLPEPGLAGMAAVGMVWGLGRRRRSA